MDVRMITERERQDFYNYLVSEEKCKATIEKYLRDIDAFCRGIGDTPVTKEAVVAFKQQLLEQGYAVRSVNSMLASVNSLFSFLGWQNCRVKSLRIQRDVYRSESRELTKAEYFRLLGAARKPGLRLMLETICATGIRVSEVRFFTVEAMLAGEITVRCKSKTRRILIPGKLRKRLLNFAQKEKIHSGSIFLGRNGKPLDRSRIWALMKSLCATAGVEKSKVFPHNLRKLFARTFYSQKKDIAKLADILGHSNINTTRIYIISTGSEHRRQIESLGLISQGIT